MRLTLAVFVTAVALVATACGDDGDASAPTRPIDASQVTLLTHDSFAIPDGVFEGFTERTGIDVTVIQGGDAGAVTSQLLLTRDNPQADVVFGLDNTFLSRATDAGVLEPYESPALASIPETLREGTGGVATPIDYGDVCVNYDRSAFGGDLEPPASLRDLAAPEYAGMLVVENPATSSPGLAFLLATIAEFGEDGDYPWQAYWTDLAANDVVVTAGWEEAYYGEFSGGSGSGTRPLVVSYATSPPAEVIFSDPRPVSAPTGVAADTCFRQVEYAAILAGHDSGPAAADLVDFMLSSEFQDEIGLSMFVYPASSDAAIPPEFTEFAAVPDQSRSLPPEQIATGRDGWIAAWTELMR